MMVRPLTEDEKEEEEWSAETTPRLLEATAMSTLSSSVMVSNTFEVRLRMTLTNCGGAASMMNLASLVLTPAIFWSTSLLSASNEEGERESNTFLLKGERKMAMEEIWWGIEGTKMAYIYNIQMDMIIGEWRLLYGFDV